MGEMVLNQVAEVSARLARQAGAAILNVYKSDFSVEYKADASPLTQADTTANKIIVTGLRQHFPTAAILAEESKDDKSRLTNDWCFLVDPLDGTKEFVKRNGQFTVNIALAYKGKVVCGVIYVPVSNDLYFAHAKKGAWFSPGGIEPRQIFVTAKMNDLTVVASASHRDPREEMLLEKNKERLGQTISAGSSLKGCLVASAEADVYYRFGLTSQWDTAAMQCIVEEAGGIFRQGNGEEMRYNREELLNENGFFAVNRKENIWI